MPLNTALRLYRGVANCDSKALSSGLKSLWLSQLRDFIIENKEDSRFDHNIWLTVCDCASRTKDDKLQQIAIEQFTKNFDFETLRTKPVEEESSTGGRKIKRVMESEKFSAKS